MTGYGRRRFTRTTGPLPRQVICRHPKCPPRRNLALKIACAPEYRESALQGFRRPISETALHTGRLSKSYRCAGQTRNRLTISYLTITAAQAFFNTRLRQCPKLSPSAISVLRHRHQHPSSIFSLRVTPAPPPEIVHSDGGAGVNNVF